MHHFQPTRFYSLLAALAFAAAMQAIASPLDHWSWCNPRPQGNAINNLVNANATFIMLGVNGLILTSSDGTNWVDRQSGSIDSLSDCAYGNGLFVVVGEYGTVLTSADTINWSVRYTPTFYNLYGVTYGNGRFVAVGEATTILTSENGIDWTRQTDGPWTLYDVVWGSNLFVAVGGVRQVGRPAETTILTSADGQFWTRRPVVTDGLLTSVAYGDGRFAASMPPSYEIGYTAIWNSTDGLSWRRNDIGPDLQLRSVIYTGGRWLASGGRWYDYFGEGRIYTSPDLTMWSLVSTSASEVVAVAYKDGFFAAAGRDGTTMLSGDATNWANPYSDLRFARFNDLKFLNGRFFATGYAFNNHYGIATSDDGCQWAEHEKFTNEWNNGFELLSIAYANGLYVAGGEYRTVWVSSDGLTWSNPAPDLRVGNYVAPVSGIVYGKGLFVATGGFVHGDMLVSSNGLDWAVHTNAIDPYDYIRFNDVAFGADRFVACGDGHLGVSSDATNWVILEFGYPTNFYAIAYGNGKFVTAGYGLIGTSSDGTNWTIQFSSEFGSLQDIAFGAGWFVAVGGDLDGIESPIWVSQDGVDWSPRRSGTSRGLTRVTFGNGTFVIGGAAGAILSSEPIVQLAITMQPHGQLTVSGPTNRRYRIDWAAQPGSSTWSPLMTVTPDSMPFVMTDPTFPAGVQKCYRAVLLPK